MISVLGQTLKNIFSLIYSRKKLKHFQRLPSHVTIFNQSNFPSDWSLGILERISLNIWTCRVSRLSVDGFGRRLKETSSKRNGTVRLTVPVLVRNNRNGLRDGSGFIQIKRMEWTVKERWHNCSFTARNPFVCLKGMFLVSVLAVRWQFLLIKTVCWPFLLNKTVSWPLLFNITVHWPFLFHGTASDSKERTGKSPVPVLDDMNGTAKTNGTVTVEIKNRPYLRYTTTAPRINQSQSTDN